MQKILKCAQFASIEAGKEIMKYFETNLTIRQKGFQNPVTEADLSANKIIHKILIGVYPDFGWLSEETKDSSNRLNKEYVWVVDPMDGTKEFIEGIPHFVVSIGLVKNGAPIIGVLYNPVTEEIFYSEKGQGAYYNHKPIKCSTNEEMNEIDIVVSRSEIKAGLWKEYNNVFKNKHEIGSVAYKLGLVASGQYDFFVTLKPKNEWDICAGQIILTEAGGILRNIDSFKPPKFNQKNTLQKPGLLGGNLSICSSFYNKYKKQNSVLN